MSPSYVPNTAKALEAILLIANRYPGIDIYRLVKASFFADKHHIQKYGRPVCGDVYEAATYGPLPRVMYGLLRGEPIEMIALGGNGDLPFAVRGRYEVHATRQANLSKLSATDKEALEHGADHVRDKTFEELFDETHSDPAYRNAIGLRMNYRDFVDPGDPDYDRKVRFIDETAEFATF